MSITIPIYAAVAIIVSMLVVCFISYLIGCGNRSELEMIIGIERHEKMILQMRYDELKATILKHLPKPDKQ